MNTKLKLQWVDLNFVFFLLVWYYQQKVNTCHIFAYLFTGFSFKYISFCKSFTSVGESWGVFVNQFHLILLHKVCNQWLKSTPNCKWISIECFLVGILKKLFLLKREYYLPSHVACMHSALFCCNAWSWINFVNILILDMLKLRTHWILPMMKQGGYNRHGWWIQRIHREIWGVYKVCMNGGRMGGGIGQYGHLIDKASFSGMDVGRCMYWNAGGVEQKKHKWMKGRGGSACPSVKRSMPLQARHTASDKVQGLE